MSQLGCCRYCSRPAPARAASWVARFGGIIFCDAVCEAAINSGLAALLERELMAAE